MPIDKEIAARVAVAVKAVDDATVTFRHNATIGLDNTAVHAGRSLKALNVAITQLRDLTMYQRYRQGLTYKELGYEYEMTNQRCSQIVRAVDAEIHEYFYPGIHHEPRPGNNGYNFRLHRTEGK